MLHPRPEVCILLVLIPLIMCVANPIVEGHIYVISNLWLKSKYFSLDHENFILGGGDRNPCNEGQSLSLYKGDIIGSEGGNILNGRSGLLGINISLGFG